MKLKCRKCKKGYNNLAGDLCFYCDRLHWEAYWNKQFDSKGKK